MINVQVATVLSSTFYGYDPDPRIVWLKHIALTPSGNVVTCYSSHEEMPDGYIRQSYNQLDIPFVVRGRENLDPAGDPTTPPASP